MRFDHAERSWRDDGFVILRGYLSAEDLAPALGELELCFPSAEGFHLRYPGLDLTPWR